MPNTSRWYANLEAFKAETGLSGSALDSVIASKIEAASEDIEREFGRRFIPLTATKYYAYPSKSASTYCLKLDDDLIAVTALTKDTDDVTAIASTDYFLEPVNSGPPYDRIEIDLASSAYFSAEDTHQRALRVTGRWGFSEDTKPAGALAEALDTSETGVDVTDASLVGVGDTIKVDSEQMFVSGRSALTTGTTLNDTLTTDLNDVTVTVASGAAIKQGEVIRLDSERMLVESISGNDLTVRRGVDGSVQAAHTTGITVYADRTLTVVRAVNGTTAAAHDTATALVKYAPPADIVELCIAQAINHLKQSGSSWSGQIGGGDGSTSMRTTSLPDLWKSARSRFKRWTFA